MNGNGRTSPELAERNQHLHHRTTTTTRQWIRTAILCFASLVAGMSISNDITATNYGPQSIEQTSSDNHNNNINVQQPHHRYHHSYQSAISTIRCLTTPGCFPGAKCHKGIPKRIKQKTSWEMRGFCVDDLISNPECLVYSFGINGNIDWEEKIAKTFGCEIHAFDPTSTNMPKSEYVTFHPWGLQGEGTNVSSTHSWNYDEIDADSSILLTLGEIMRRLNHTHLDVLTMDCEGCEWGVLRQMACNGDSALVDQLVVEAHFQKNLGFATEEDVMVAAEAITCLEQERWSLVSLEEAGCAPEDSEYVGETAKIVPDLFFLAYLNFQRTPEDKPQVWELRQQSAHTYRNATLKYRELEKNYGYNYNKWPSNATSEHAAFQKLRDRDYAAYNSQYVKKVWYDKPPDLDEEKYLQLNKKRLEKLSLKQATTKPGKFSREDWLVCTKGNCSKAVAESS